MRESYILVLGYTLKDARNYIGLTQSQVVEQLIKNSHYTTIQSLRNWELGINMPNKKMRKVLDEFYKKEIRNMDRMLTFS